MRSFLKLSVAVSSTVSATLATAVFSPAFAQAVGNVISSTPVMKRVTETPRGCQPAPQRACELVTEDRLIGYKVVYEYNGKQHEVQLPFAVGATIPLETSSSGSPSAGVTPTVTPTPSYESAPPIVQRVVVEPRYVERVRVYDDPYYYGPIWPAAVVGLSLGYIAGRAYLPNYWPSSGYYGPRGHVYYRGGWRGHRH
jgi:hypothetical protein